MKKFLTVVVCLICIIACAVVVFNTINSNVPEEMAVTLPDNTDSFGYKQPEEIKKLGSPYKHYYEKLTDIEKMVYDKILSEIYTMPESIDLLRIDGEQFKAVFSALLKDNPDLFFLGRESGLESRALIMSWKVPYIIDPADYEKCKAELDAVCEDVISSLSDPTDEWQTELEIHDYIVENCKYGIVKNEYIYSSAYGALVNGEAGCEGYSKAAKLLLDMAGIESAVVNGDARSSEDDEYGAHMWNVVKIDGDYYHLDCTWDDPETKEGKEIKQYLYFNLSDEMIARTHTDFSYDFSCTATAANYCIKTNSVFETYDRSDEKAVAEIIAENLEAGCENIEIRFTQKDVFDNAVHDLMKVGRLSVVLDLVSKDTGFEFNKKTTGYDTDEERLALYIYPDAE